MQLYDIQNNMTEWYWNIYFSSFKMNIKITKKYLQYNNINQIYIVTLVFSKT